MSIFRNAASHRTSVRLHKGVIVAIFLSVLLLFTGSTAAGVSTTVVINEVYGGAGCGTAGCSTFQNDFVELKNISAFPVDISNWSIQYTSAAGSSWAVTAIPAATILSAGSTYLIAQAFGANGVNALPTPNLTGTIAMSATAGKVVLVNNTTALTGTGCPFAVQVVDFIGYGATANCSETAAAPAPSTTTSVARNLSVDTDVNNIDFTAGAPTPQAGGASAAGAFISGRVIGANGRGIARVTVTLSGGALETTRTALTSLFGYYRFEEVAVGQSYLISVSAKGYSFAQPSRPISLFEDLSGEDFQAEPR